MNLSDLRRNYTSKTLDEKDVMPDALLQFNAWMDEAIECKVHEPNAMALATVNADGRPSTRIVLLKEVHDGGFVFFTNYHSHKGRDIAANPHVAACFLWHDLERQIRIEGVAEKVSDSASEAYFHSRPRGSQLGAMVSAQSTVIAGRRELEEAYKYLDEKYAHIDIPKPAHWGGYIIKPSVIEFWQGRTSRLHDRLRYRHMSNNSWLIERLAP